MTGGDKPIRWRLTSISATGDEARYVAAMTDPDAQNRQYTFLREVVDESANFSMWTTGDWDRDTIYDRDAYKAVMDAVIALYNARQREIAFGDAKERKPPPGSLWRLISIRATEDDSRYVSVVSDPDGQTREYTFVYETLDLSGGDVIFMWTTGDWDRDTIYDRTSYKAVVDAVKAFYEARQREMALGDDENRKPPGL